jgi:hypothetical protein
MVELMLSDALMQISLPDLRQDLDPLLQKENHCYCYRDPRDISGAYPLEVSNEQAVFPTRSEGR